MPIRYVHDSSAGVLRITMGGSVSASDVENYRAALASSHPEYATVPRLIDVTHVEAPPSKFVIHDLARAITTGARGARVRRAIVASADVKYGMFRMLELLIAEKAEGEYRVFRTMEEAELWLGLKGSSSPSAK